MNHCKSWVVMLPFLLVSCSCSREKVVTQAPEAPGVRGTVKEVTAFDDIRLHDKAIVKFYATWCGACKASKVPFEELAGAYGHIPFFAVDVDKAGEFAKQFEINSIPTVIIFEKGVAKETMVGLDVEKIKQLLGAVAKITEIAKEVVKGEIAPIVAITNVDQFQPEVLEIKGRPVIVKFYASWCGFCKMVAPIYKEFAQKYGDKVKFVEVEMSNQTDLAKKYDIKGFPTFIIFIDGKKHNMFSGANKQKLENAIKAVYGA